jgi:pimeloyl-ACP methyl ester carboxylesterase
MSVALLLGLEVPGWVGSGGALQLSSCKLKDYAGPARCGRLSVPEDPSWPGGRQLSLRLAVLPAKGADARPDPVFVFDGGPGESAVNDVGWYMTPFAVDDVDRVRAALGYQRIGLYGISAGSREALVYMRRHPTRVRGAVISAVTPPDRRVVLMSVRSAQTSMRRLLDDCVEDPR